MIMNLYRTGQVDAMTAMKMIADLSESGKPVMGSDAPKPCKPEEKVPAKKRDRSPDRESVDITDDDVNEFGSHLEPRLILDVFPSNLFLKS